MKFAVIGGDLRTIKLVQMLAKDGNQINIYGLEKAKELIEQKNIISCENIFDAINKSDIVIGPIPFSSNQREINTPFSDKKITIDEMICNIDGKILIAGAIAPEIYKMKDIKIVDIMNQEQLTVLNTIATAEGTIELMINNTNKIIHGSNVLILGFGRVAKTLANKICALNANVSCAARKKEDIAWISTYGYKAVNIEKIDKEYGNYDIIINTVPHLILNKEKLKYVNKNSLLIDLASKPGGIDFKVAEKYKIKCIWALALPGKVAPVSTAEFLKDTIYEVIS